MTFIKLLTSVLNDVYDKTEQNQLNDNNHLVIEGRPYKYVYYQPLLFSYVKREDRQNLTQYMNPSMWVIVLHTLFPEMESYSKNEQLQALQNLVRTFFAHVDDLFLKYKAYGIKKLELMKLFQSNMNHPIFKDGLSQLFHLNILVWDHNNVLKEHYPDRLELSNETICVKVNELNNYQQIIIEDFDMESLQIPLTV